MNSRFRIVGALTIVAILVSALLSRAAEPPPNIILLLADDQRWDSLGCTGGKLIKTPNIDRLAAEGTLFENNFCATAICCVSRASIFTGQYARRHGINDFATSLTDDAFKRTYPGRLRAAGYHTGFIGKWGVGTDLREKDFDYYDGFGGQGKYFAEIDGKKVHLTRLQTDSAVKFIRSAPKGKPFCLSLSYKAPHADDGAGKPYASDPAQDSILANESVPHAKTADEAHHNALPEFIRNSEGRTRFLRELSPEATFQDSAKGYYRLIAGIDESVGEIMAALRESGADKNTVVIYTSDNGFFLGERGLQGKWLMYEESIRTPLVVWDPREPAARRGVRRTEMTLNIDLAPTMLALAGLEPSPETDGRSLLPLLNGGKSLWREIWYYDHLYGHGGKIPTTEGVRTGGMKYTRYLGTRPLYEELFDLGADPLEERNLASQPGSQATLEQMRKICDDLREGIPKSGPR